MHNLAVTGLQDIHPLDLNTGILKSCLFGEHATKKSISSHATGHVDQIRPDDLGTGRKTVQFEQGMHQDQLIRSAQRPYPPRPTKQPNRPLIIITARVNPSTDSASDDSLRHQDQRPARVSPARLKIATVKTHSRQVLVYPRITRSRDPRDTQ